MGNLMATSMSIALPLINYSYVLPYIFYPTRWGIPWSPPGSLMAGLIGLVIITVELMIVGSISGIMNTVKSCNKIDVKMSVKRSMWIILGYMLGNVLLFTMPFLKAPLLIMTIGLPYAGWIAHGIMTAIPVMLFGAMGIDRLLGDVCT